MKNSDKQIQIRNSTADFLVFARQNGEDGIAVRVEDENVWLTSEAVAMLFQKTRPTIVEHLKNIFTSGELEENSVCRNFRHTADDGKDYGNRRTGISATASRSRNIQRRIRKHTLRVFVPSCETLKENKS